MSLIGSPLYFLVCSMVEGKTPMQCMFRYKCLKPGTKKGPWSKEENEVSCSLSCDFTLVLVSLEIQFLFHILKFLYIPTLNVQYL